MDLLPEDTIPALGSITRFVHARGMAPEDLMQALCEAVGRAEPTRSPGTFLADLGEGPPLVVVVDAVDEAIGKRDSPSGKDLSVVQQVLQPLIAGAARTRLRLLIGTRRHLLDPLGTPWPTRRPASPGYSTSTTPRTPTGRASAATSNPAC